MLDQERCIQCSRCTRFCDAVSGTGELAFFQRGSRTVIGVWPGSPLDNPYSGNVVDICPVGALTLKEFRFRTRVWYLKNTPSVCAGCARGCNVFVAVGRQQEMMTSPGQLDDGIKRIVPRVNESVNGHWMCDAGRLSYQRVEGAPRLLAAQRKDGAKLEWDAAVEQAAARLKTAAAAGRAGALLSPRLTAETLFAWRQVLRTLGDVPIGIGSLVDGEDDELLIRADKAANATGARWILGDHTDAREVLDAVELGRLDSLLVVGDVLDPGNTPPLDETQLSKLSEVIYVGPFAGGAAEQAQFRLPAAAWAEEDGTLVNFEGRVQRTARAHRPRGDCRPGWRVAADIGLAAGLELPAWADAADVLASLAAEVAPFAGLTTESIGLLGVTPDAATAER